MNLFELTCNQFTERFRKQYGKGACHAESLYRSFYADVGFDPASLPCFAASPQSRQAVVTQFSHRVPEVIDRQSRDGVTKLALALSDGRVVETVVIPMANHATVCVSSQVGCRMGCRFCETGGMGLIRNLTAAEIVAQVFMVKVVLGIVARNVVFMGMGEPLDNFDAVVQAIRVLEDQRGLNIAKRRITLSTAGLVEGIRSLAALDWPHLKLAVSLNAADDVVRRSLMPVAGRHTMAALKQELQTFPMARGNVLLMEYVLIKGVNDDPAHAARLALFLKELPPVRLNLIPCNPRSSASYAPPSATDMDRFHQRLINDGIFVRMRKSKGADIQGACGQLGGRQAKGVGKR
ncbi:MAG: 23S rRNA (adenine(2503)-C(2))-methyltransferase RlmN [Desulfatitalea sp.]|nr:23S rRNA (adenine(2503)-C(2))-methyltransferase RlmN [Desulfatitalea sp.]NNK02235.1 23S rRNA (adenine(2503)-C(2))-methyltransferase RlmN [Desulfatitalea sp.]